MLLPSTDFDEPLDPNASPETLASETEVLEEMLYLAREEALWDLEKSLERRREKVRRVRRGPRGMVVGDGSRELREGRACGCCI